MIGRSGVLKKALEESVEGLIRRGRRRLKLLDEIKIRNYVEAKKMALDRNRVRQRWSNGPAN